MDPLEQYYVPSVSSLPARPGIVGETSNPIPDLALWYTLASRPNVAPVITPPTRVSRLAPFSQHPTRLFTKRRTPVNLRREVALPYNMGLVSKELWLYQQSILSLPWTRIYSRPTNPNPYHNLGILVLSAQLGVPLPDELREIASYRRLRIKSHTPVYTEERSSKVLNEEFEEVLIRGPINSQRLEQDVESPLWQYGSYRPPNLGKYSPEER
ncbi:hypothetical protein V565_357530, partial [Rhizoctonia solani 123E]